MNPENLEPSNEKQEKAKKIEKLLNPDLDNAITLYKEIDENIYFGAKEYEDRALRVEACGYDAKTLSHIGKSAKTEMRDMHEDSIGRPMSPTQKAEFDLLRSITLSQIGPKGESFGYHSELSVGLASELVRQMKKAALFIQEPDSDEKTIKKIFGSRGLNLVDEKDAENIITISKEDFEKKREDALKYILTINSSNKELQYRTAFNVLESTLYPEKPPVENLRAGMEISDEKANELRAQLKATLLHSKQSELSQAEIDSANLKAQLLREEKLKPSVSKPRVKPEGITRRVEISNEKAEELRRLAAESSVNQPAEKIEEKPAQPKKGFFKRLFKL